MTAVIPVSSGDIPYDSKHYYIVTYTASLPDSYPASTASERYIEQLYAGVLPNEKGAYILFYGQQGKTRGVEQS